MNEIVLYGEIKQMQIAIHKLGEMVAAIRWGLHAKGLMSNEEFDVFLAQIVSEMDQQQAHERSKN